MPTSVRHSVHLAAYYAFRAVVMMLLMIARPHIYAPICVGLVMNIVLVMRKNVDSGMLFYIIFISTNSFTVLDIQGSMCML